MARMEMTLQDLADFARRVVAELPQTAGERAHVIGLSGPLGAGKTTFVQIVARELGVLGTVPSPTFTLVRPYDISHPVFKRLIHIDAYRLLERDAGGIGWEDYHSDPKNIILVEWPENLGAEIASHIPTIRFSVVDEETRGIAHYV